MTAPPPSRTAPGRRPPSAMSKSARTIYAFYLYMIVAGAGFVLVPNVFMGLIGFPETEGVWVRALGMMTMIMGYYYGVMARNDVKEFFMATVYGRTAVLFFFAGFVIAGLAPPALLLLAAVDVSGAIWTFTALRSEQIQDG